jgi:ubiquinone biosynthesis protein COQ9
VIATPERSPERDAALEALLLFVPGRGWTMAALRSALPDPADAELLFPNGTADLLEAFADLTDRRMVEAAGDLSALRTHARVRALIAHRLAWLRPHKAALRRAAALLALPAHAAVAARAAARTLDAIWYAAGDRSADFTWYTKRATLAFVYSTCFMYWMQDTSPEDEATLAFLDRRLDDVARLGRLRRGCPVAA